MITQAFGSVVTFIAVPQRQWNHSDYAWARRRVPDHLPLMKLSLIEQAAGPRMTMNRVGRMNMISGIVMIAGRRAAFSSARIMRSLRNSADSTRRAEDSGVPYFSV